MIRLIGILLWLCSVPVAAQDQWLHVSGWSLHDRPGLQERNWGVGWETRTTNTWSLAGGIYRNSLDRDSIYVLTKYHWIQRNHWSVNVNAGVVTGYETAPMAPVLLPELCVSWLCGMFIPRIGSNQAAAMAIYLRIPL